MCFVSNKSNKFHFRNGLDISCANGVQNQNDREANQVLEDVVINFREALFDILISDIQACL